MKRSAAGVATMAEDRQGSQVEAPKETASEIALASERLLRKAAPSRGSVEVVLRLVPKSRTPAKGSKWVAFCEWDGRRFEARSRNGAVYALCRELVAAGCPDQSMRVVNAEGRVQLTIRSIRAGAGRTIKEGPATKITNVPFAEYPAARASGFHSRGESTSAPGGQRPRTRRSRRRGSEVQSNWEIDHASI
jgi:hypothetical protein